MITGINSNQAFGYKCKVTLTPSANKSNVLQKIKGLSDPKELGINPESIGPWEEYLGTITCSDPEIIPHTKGMKKFTVSDDKKTSFPLKHVLEFIFGAGRVE